MSLRIGALGALLCAVCAPVVANAQSRRYPPEPVDKDREAEQHSELWESALDPDLGPYMQLVKDAEQHIARNTGEDAMRAFELLEQAIARMPSESRAYTLRGRLYLSRRNWKPCAADLAAAEDHSKEPDTVARTRLRIDLGVCQARSGQIADAERTLVTAAANATAYRGELGLRLGEVRIALGKLDEAIDALTAALEFGDIQHHLTRWLLVLAYDRARRPTEASEQAELARKQDPQRNVIESPPLPLVSAGDTQYLLGVAYRYATPKPEYALLYFRSFLRIVPADSPWRRRAEEHVRDLSNLRFPAKETISTTGPASTTVDDMRASAEKNMPALRKCLAQVPASAFQITFTKLGPRTPDTARDRPLYRMPTPGIKVAPILTTDSRKDLLALDAASKCVETEAAKLKLPVPKERDTWYMMSFLVVAP